MPLWRLGLLLAGYAISATSIAVLLYFGFRRTGRDNLADPWRHFKPWRVPAALLDGLRDPRGRRWGLLLGLGTLLAAVATWLPEP